MIHINLLPWREALREQRKKEFLISLGMTAGGAFLFLLLIHLFMNGRINHQNRINQFVQNDIAFYELKIKEIRNLEKEKSTLLSRMKIIHELELDRPFVVHLFDELASILPNGIFVNSVFRKDDQLTISGQATSNAGISQLMRNVESSKWIQQPILTEIKTDNKLEGAKSNFNLKIKEQPKKTKTEDKATDKHGK